MQWSDSKSTDALKMSHQSVNPTPPPSLTPTTKPVQHLVQCDLRWPQLSRMHLFHCGRQHLVIPLLSVLRLVFISATHSSTHTHPRTSMHTDTPAPVVCQPPPLVSITLHFVCCCFFFPQRLSDLLNVCWQEGMHTIFGVFYLKFFVVFFLAEWLIGFSTGVQSVDWLSAHAGHQILVFVLFIFNFYFFIFIIHVHPVQLLFVLQISVSLT